MSQFLGKSLHSLVREFNISCLVHFSSYFRRNANISLHIIFKQ
ncbi:hypothetical protein Nmel_009091 [Mimus melanotis]